MAPDGNAVFAFRVFSISLVFLESQGLPGVAPGGFLGVSRGLLKTQGKVKNVEGNLKGPLKGLSKNFYRP